MLRIYKAWVYRLSVTAKINCLSWQTTKPPYAQSLLKPREASNKECKLPVALLFAPVVPRTNVWVWRSQFPGSSVSLQQRLLVSCKPGLPHLFKHLYLLVQFTTSFLIPLIGFGTRLPALSKNQLLAINEASLGS